MTKDELDEIQNDPYKEYKLREISDATWNISREAVSRIDDKNELAKLIYYLSMGFPKEAVCFKSEASKDLYFKSDYKVYIDIDKLNSEDRIKLLIGGIY